MSEEFKEIVTLELTPDEAEVVTNYIFHRMGRLEDANLKDSKCYPLLCSVYYKLIRQRNKTKENM